MYGEKLRFLREEKEINQYVLSELLNLNKEVYGQYEREYVTIPMKHLITLAKYFKVSIDYIFGFTEKKKYNSVKDFSAKNSGIRLKEFRKSKNLTQEKLAIFLNTNKSVICRYENGTNIIATPFLYTICKKYKVSADYLLGISDNPKFYS